MLIAVRYHEIALKGGNRPFFVDRLALSLRRATSDLGPGRVRVLPGRLTVEMPDEIPWEAARDRVATVLGVANFSRVHEVPPDMQALKAAALDAVRGREMGSFRVRARRSDKRFPLISLQIERELGGAIHLLLVVALVLIVLNLLQGRRVL